MDEIEIGDLAVAQNVVIFCSTWGEGEMPDNAVDLWEAANGDSPPSLEGCNFAVCALGDTSYEFFCQSGKDWDGWFEKQGATRLIDRIDCDVEYDDPAAEFTTNVLALLSSTATGGMIPSEDESSNESEVPPEDDSEGAPDEISSGDLEGLISSG
ncbi:MAG TPA: flavodoxin domain-containing protein, partial [Candidatus Thalassarchaeum sp.]|nr:flavodoxin domain-containing protein [Candidatus Thalassarchaeum sp.]